MEEENQIVQTESHNMESEHHNMETEQENQSDILSPSSGLSSPEEQSYMSSTAIQIATPSVIPILTPNGTREWVPTCSNDLKPKLGMKFDSIEIGFQFYRSYALAGGFSTRKSTSRKREDDVIREQFFVCNKQGYKDQRKPKASNDKKRRKRPNTRFGCKAMIVIRLYDDEKYEVIKFKEEHSHQLYTPSCVQYQKEARSMGLPQKKMIFDNTKVNVGPVRTFRQAKELYGGYENIGASKNDFKNFQRDLKAYIYDSDAQMFVNNFKNKQSSSGGFFFEYEVDAEGRLCRALWADALCRRNYALYGDMVSFDTTYSTNRYNMVFGPFTGIDNHKRCITFAACLLSNEDIVSFEWVFKTFLQCMQNNEPTCLITDQDPAMIVAVQTVFKKTEHRLCMWHIMKKLPEKIGTQMEHKDLFLSKINRCVWNVETEPEEFEAEWKQVISEFNLQEHSWLSSLYGKKEMWIPAYFRDCFLAGLMRTTSRSESENHFFTTFTNAHITLVEFNMRFETALDAQRHAQGQNDTDSKYTKPMCKTPLKMEMQAAEMFTRTVFYEVQKQVVAASFFCGANKIETDNETHTITVEETFETYEGCEKKQHEVVYNSINSDTICTCKKFNRIGIPCRHMILVWKEKLMTKIPEKYILNRWTILAAKKSSVYLDSNIIEECARALDKKRMLNDLWSELHLCVTLAEDDEDNLTDLIKNMKQLRAELEDKKKAKTNSVTKSRKIQDIEMLIGTTLPDEIVVKEPKIAKNKGSGVQLTNSEKRLKTGKENAIEQNKKKLRKCNRCGKICTHDKRTCAKITAQEKAAKAKTSSGAGTAA